MKERSSKRFSVWICGLIAVMLLAVIMPGISTAKAETEEYTYRFEETLVETDCKVLSSEDGTDKAWSFADDYASLGFTAIQSGSMGLKYTFNFKAPEEPSEERFFAMMFGPSNLNNDGASVMWNGISTAAGQFRLVFLVQANNEALCPVYVWPYNPKTGEPISQLTEWKDWAYVGSCYYGADFDFDITIYDNGANYDFSVGASGEDETVSAQLNDYFNTYVGSLYKNVNGKTNIAFNYVNDSGPLPGELTLVSYTQRNIVPVEKPAEPEPVKETDPPKEEVKEEVKPEEPIKNTEAAYTVLIGCSVIAAEILGLAIFLIIKFLFGNMPLALGITLTALLVAGLITAAVFGVPFVINVITGLGGL